MTLGSSDGQSADTAPEFLPTVPRSFFDMCCLFQPEPCPLDNLLLIIPTSDRKKLGASFWHTVLQITPYAVVICWYIDIDLGRILGGDIP